MLAWQAAAMNSHLYLDQQCDKLLCLLGSEPSVFRDGKLHRCQRHGFVRCVI